MVCYSTKSRQDVKHQPVKVAEIAEQEDLTSEDESEEEEKKELSTRDIILQEKFRKFEHRIDSILKDEYEGSNVTRVCMP